MGSCELTVSETTRLALVKITQLIAPSQVACCAQPVQSNNIGMQVSGVDEPKLQANKRPGFWRLPGKGETRFNLSAELVAAWRTREHRYLDE